MSLWDKIFSKKEEVKDVEGIKAYFGRFTDAYKSTEQYEAWDKAVLHFENRDFQMQLQNLSIISGIHQNIM